MKKKQSPTKLVIENLLEHWNRNCEEAGTNEQFNIKYERVEESIKVGVHDGYANIGRLTLNLMKVIREESTFENIEIFNEYPGDTEKVETKGKVLDVITTLLFKRDFPISKISHDKEEYWQECLSRELLYECLGNFCMITRGLAIDRIRLQDQQKLANEISAKINTEENAILNKSEELKTEEDKVFALMKKSQNIKVQKTGLIDKFGSDIVSEIIN